MDTSKHYSNAEIDGLKKGQLLLLCDELGLADAGHTVASMRDALKDHYAEHDSPPPAKKPKKAPVPAPPAPISKPDPGKWQVLLAGKWTDYDAEKTALMEEAFVAGRHTAQWTDERGMPRPL